MWNETQKEALLNECKKHAYKDTENVIVPEPYLPYMPENWNGILVLAESQSSNAGEYWDWVKEKSELAKLECMQRLGKYPKGGLSIGPWDDGTVKLAVQAIFEGANLDLKFEDVAVSNAVPWTRGGGNNSKNLRPDGQMIAKAVDFWKDIFEVWNPDIKALIVLGNIAEEVMNAPGIKEKYKKNQLKLRSPSRRYISLVSGMFDCDDLKARFTEVQKALETPKISKDVKDYYKNKVFFACHAVSLGVPKFKEWFGGVK